MVGAVLLETPKPPKTINNIFEKQILRKTIFSRFTNRSLVHLQNGDPRVPQEPGSQRDPRAPNGHQKNTKTVEKLEKWVFRKILLGNMLVRYRGINNKGVWRDPGQNGGFREPFLLH